MFAALNRKPNIAYVDTPVEIRDKYQYFTEARMERLRAAGYAEPFTSLDDRAIAVLQQLLSDARARGSTIIMSTHQIREAMELASDVALLERGRMIFAGPRTGEMLLDPGYLYRTYAEARAENKN